MRLILFVFLCCVAAMTAPRLHIVTVASDMTKGLSYLLKSAHYNGLMVDVKGMGTTYRGNGMKLVYLREFIELLPDDDLVMLVDAYDVLLLAGESEILSRFEGFGVPCVMADETNLQPSWVVRFESKFPVSRARFKYLNAGGVMGYVFYLKKMLREMQPIIPTASDQGQLIRYYVKHQHEIRLDFACNIFVALHDVKKHEPLIDGPKKQVKVIETGTFPCVVHGNGSGKMLYASIARAFFK